MRADEIDEKIDAALRSYANPPETPEPRVALARILERAREEETQRRRWWPWLIPAAGCAAAVLTAAVLVMRAPVTSQIAFTPKAPGVVSVAGAPVQEPIARTKARVAQKPPLQAAARELPKLEMFPAPMPLASEEQKLVAFTRQTPPAVLHQVIEAKQHNDDPLEIAELKIQPLATSDEPVPPKGKNQ